MYDWEIEGKDNPDDDYEYRYEDFLSDKPAPEDAEEEDEGEWWNEEESEEQEEENFDDYSEDDSPDDCPNETIEQLLAIENVMEKLNPFLEEVKEETEAERFSKMLKRELRDEALARMERAARTAEEYASVVAVWNRLDENRMRKERYHEICREPEMLEVGRSDLGLIFPLWYTNPTVRQLYRGDFWDYLNDCPYLMHELTSKGAIRKPVKRMKEDHKELLYFLYLRLYSAVEVAALRGQSDRNIRKVRNTMLKKLRKQVYLNFKKQQEQGDNLTLRERRFVEDYEKSL